MPIQESAQDQYRRHHVVIEGAFPLSSHPNLVSATRKSASRPLYNRQSISRMSRLLVEAVLILVVQGYVLPPNFECLTICDTFKFLDLVGTDSEML